MILISVCYTERKIAMTMTMTIAFTYNDLLRTDPLTAIFKCKEATVKLSFLCYFFCLFFLLGGKITNNID